MVLPLQLIYHISFNKVPKLATFYVGNEAIHYIHSKTERCGLQKPFVNQRWQPYPKMLMKIKFIINISHEAYLQFLQQWKAKDVWLHTCTNVHDSLPLCLYGLQNNILWSITEAI